MQKKLATMSLVMEMIPLPVSRQYSNSYQSLYSEFTLDELAKKTLRFLTFCYSPESPQ